MQIPEILPRIDERQLILGLRSSVFLLAFGVSQPVSLASTCYGLDPCNACHTCAYCKHCNSGGNPCGVLLAERGESRASSPHKTAAHKVKKAIVSEKDQPVEVWGPGMPKGEWLWSESKHFYRKDGTQPVRHRNIDADNVRKGVIIGHPQDNSTETTQHHLEQQMEGAR